MKYIIVDLSYRGLDLDDVELDDEWYVDDENDVCHECKNEYEFAESLLWNISNYTYEEGLDNIEDYITSAIANLLEDDYYEINGFGYFIER